MAGSFIVGVRLVGVVLFVLIPSISVRDNRVIMGVHVNRAPVGLDVFVPADFRDLIVA